MNDYSLTLSHPCTPYADLKEVVSLIEWLERHDDRDADGGIVIEGGHLLVWNKDGYPVGTVSYEDDQWWFTPASDAAVRREEGAS